MRPRYLEFCGVNSFSETARIDFEDLLRYGTFGIFGDTGSGKSTILDCITFALYGGTSRIRTGNTDLINYRCDRAYVIFEFEIFFEGERKIFRVERELRRKNASHTLKVVECGKNLVRAEGVREGKALLEKIVGLEQKDFEKCIALPQGEFAQFVKEQRSERLKIVSRLFDLEEYGEKLVARANANYRERFAAWSVAKTRLEPYAEVSKERLNALEEETETLRKEETAARSALEEARRRESELSEKYRKRQELEGVRARLSRLKEEEEEIAALEREFARVGHAAEVCRLAEDLAAARERMEGAEKLLAAAIAQCEKDEEARKIAAAWDEESADEEIARLTERRAKAAQREEERKKGEELALKLDRARRAYAAEAEQFREFSYEEERAKLDEELNALGEGDLYAFAESRAKAALLRGEYRVFADELKQIMQKYPETEKDVSPLAEKYETLSAGEKTDLQTVRAAYEERERKRRGLQEALVALEKRNGLYCAHRQKLQQLQTEGLRLREELNALVRDGDAPAERTETVERLLLEKKREKKRLSEERDRAQKNAAASAAARAAAEEKRRAAHTFLLHSEDRLGSALARGGFASAEEARRLAARFGDAGDAGERIKKYREELAALSAREKELAAEDLSGGSKEELDLACGQRKDLERAVEESANRLALKREEFSREQEALARKRELEGEESARRHETEIAERLKKLFEGNHFMEFIAEEYLQNVAENAGARLLSLTSGKYFLRYDGGFLVGDNLNGGSLRGVHTLSGGEIFLVSLSLALALSAEICARSSRPIEFFFLDEGFGTLDERLVDVVMDSLEKLKGEHFSIGIISHVEELKHRIEKKLYVEKATDRRGSQIHA